MSLTPISGTPYNAEAALPDLQALVTPAAHFFVRSNFPAPAIDADAWRLTLDGCVRRPVTLDCAALEALPHTTRRVTLECAGNGRRLMSPVPPGAAWLLGGAGTAEFGGVALRDVLALAGVTADAVECVFSGADQGELPDEPGPPTPVTSFQRSLPVAQSLAPEPIVAWTMNGAPLTADHGFPVRLVVPNYYAVASVKWLVRIEAVRRPFRGHFQAVRYVYRLPGEADVPVTLMRVRSLITSHTDGQEVTAGPVTVEGVAWSGHGAVSAVEVSDAAGHWHPAELDSGSSGTAAGWRCRVPIVPGSNRVRARATDTSGAKQPLASIWNALGYGNNVTHTVTLTGR